MTERTRLPSAEQRSVARGAGYSDVTTGTANTRVEAAKKAAAANDPYANETVLQTAGRQGLNLARKAADEATLSLGRPLMAGISGAIKAAQGVPDPYKTSYKAINEGMAQVDEELGMLGQIAGSTIGGLTPGGVAGRVDKAMDATTSVASKVAPALKAGAKRIARTGLAAGGINAAQGYLQGQTSFNEMAMNGGMGALFGGTAQALIGDAVGPKAMMLLEQMGKNKPAGGDMINSIAQGGGLLNAHTTAQAVDKGFLPGKGFLETNVGDPTLRRNWTGLTEYVADVAFPKVDPRKANRPKGAAQVAQYNAVMAAVNKAATNINEGVTNRLDTLIGAPANRANAVYESVQGLNDARKVYAMMSNMVPDPARPDIVPLGATPIDALAFKDKMGKELAAEFMRSEPQYMPDEAMTMFNHLKDGLRTREQQHYGGAMQKRPVDSATARADPTHPDFDQADFFQRDMPLARLMDIRKTFASKLTPMFAYKNDLDASHLKAGRKLLSLVDEEISNLTLGGYGKAKDAFAHNMQLQDSYDLGKKLYETRSTGVDDKYANVYQEYVDDYLARLAKKDPKYKEMMDLGFLSGLKDGVAKNGAIVELRNLAGLDTTLGDAGSATATKKQGFETLQRLLGPNAKEFMELIEGGPEMDKAMTDLIDTLENKLNVKPQHAVNIANKTKKIPGIVDDIPFKVGTATKSLADKIIRPGDRSKAQAAINAILRTGDPATDFFAQATEQAVGGFPRIVGARASTAGTGSADAFIDDKEAAAQEIRNFLGL